MSSKNTFMQNGDILTISREGWDIRPVATFREDYIDEMKSVTWGVNNGYLYNRKLGYLHRYIVQKWYGQEVLDAFTKADCVVDHMDGNKYNCQISNLAFLSSDENKAKGFTVDKQRHEMQWNLALNMFRDFDTGYYQITIFFNKMMYLVNSASGEYYPVSALKLLYTTGYEIVINDARSILLSYRENGKFGLGKLSYAEYRIEKARLFRLEEKDKNRAVIEIDGEEYLIINEHTRMLKINYEKGWVPQTNEEGGETDA